jgi:hypothetical protein
MHKILLATLLLLTIRLTAGQDERPTLRLTPPALTVRADSSGFVVGKVEFVNTGGGVLTISSVNGSCGCATASVQRNNIQPMAMGEIRFGINTHAFKDSVNNVDYTVTSNAMNGTVVYRVVVLKQVKAK